MNNYNKYLSLSKMSMKEYRYNLSRFYKSGLKLMLIIAMLSSPMLLNAGCVGSKDGFVTVNKPKTRNKSYNPKKHRRAKRIKKVRMKN